MFVSNFNSNKIGNSYPLMGYYGKKGHNHKWDKNIVNKK